MTFQTWSRRLPRPSRRFPSLTGRPLTRRKRLLRLGALSALSLGAGLAAPPTFLDVATSPKGTSNSDMFHDLGQVCTSSAFLRQRQTSGSVENLELLLGNQVSLAFVQLDYLKAKEQIEHDPRVRDIKQLLALNADEIHVIAPLPIRKKNIFGKVTVQGAQSYRELSGQVVGAWGGSVTTARVLAAKSGIKTQVQEFRNRDEAMTALAAGKVAAVISVVGQPADWVKALDPQRFTLLPIDLPASTFGGLYRPATLRYVGLGNGVATYAVQRLLVTRDFKTPERRAMLGKYQACARAHLTELQETPGFHPKWNEVTFSEHDWPEFKP